MTTDAETIVRRACHAAEGNVMDVQGFIDLFADDGMFNAVGQKSFRGKHLGDPVVFMGKLAPDVHRELRRVNVMGNVVAIELSIRGTFTGPFETPAGVIRGNGAKLDVPCADFWYVADGKIKQFDCYVSSSIMLEQSAYRPTSHPRSKRRSLPRRPPRSPPGGYQGFFNGDRRFWSVSPLRRSASPLVSLPGHLPAH
jgi:SnoaL-like domain